MRLMPTPPRIYEVQTELDGYLDRLHQLGATEDELMAVIETWDVFDAEWTPELRKRTTRATDAELLAGLLHTRVEYAHDTTPDDGTWQPGMDIPGGDMITVLAWVGSDRDRAYAAYQTELGRDEFARRDLLSRLFTLSQAG